MMHCGVKRRHSSTLEHIDMEHQQQTLFDLSIFKLQQEQLRHGVEPRLLRFVLINNALRALQGHIMLLDEDDSIALDCDIASDTCSSSDSFLSNTFKDGGLSTPLSTPTPVKKIKLDASIIDKSPLVTTTVPFHDSSNSSNDLGEGDCVKMNGEFKGGGVEGGGEEGGGVEGECVENGIDGSEVVAHLLGVSEKSPPNHSHTNGSICLGKRTKFECEEEEKLGSSTAWSSVDNVPDSEEIAMRGCEPKQKRLCRPSALHVNGTKLLNGLNGINGYHSSLDMDHLPPQSSSPSPSSHNHSSQQPSDESDDETPSPIDFAKVNPTLYDYDATTTLLLPGHDSSSSSSSSSAASSSSQQPQESVTSSSTTESATTAVVATSTAIPNSLPMTLAITTASVTNTTSSLTPPTTTQPLSTDVTDPLSVVSSCSSKVVESSYLATPVVSSTSSCSMEGIVSAKEELGNDDERTGSERSISTCNNGVLPSSPKGLESDFLEADIEHIVSLLMT